MTEAAKGFLASLDADQATQAVSPFSDPKREVWNYVPLDRPGVAWAAMSPAQRQAGSALLAASLSTLGAKKVEAIRQLEPVLREMERGNLGRDPERYWFAFYGRPGDEVPWTWRYEGHHVSLSFTVVGGKVVSSTPQFLGTNPAHSPVPGDPGSRGRRILAAEQDLGVELVRSLEPDQLKLARIAETAPSDIVTTNSRKASIQGRSGVPFKQLHASQQALLQRLVRTHAEVQAPAEQARRLGMIDAEGYADVVFAWMGPLDTKGRHYYRIQGARFLIEFDCTQDDGNHFHAVWRQLDGDFPTDPLADHYGRDHRSRDRRP